MKKALKIIGIILGSIIALIAVVLLVFSGMKGKAAKDLYAQLGKLPFELPSSKEAVEKQMEDLPYDSENPLFPFGYDLIY